MVLVPLDNNAAAHALCIELFDAGAWMEPEIFDGSLLKRPMDFFDEVLPQLDVSIKSNHGKLPLQVKGPLQPRNIEIDGSLSSQFLTGLLMAYSAAGADNVSIKVNNLKSRPITGKVGHYSASYANQCRFPIRFEFY